MTRHYEQVEYDRVNGRWITDDGGKKVDREVFLYSLAVGGGRLVTTAAYTDETGEPALVDTVEWDR